MTGSTQAAELQIIIDHTPFLLAHCSRDLRYLFVSKAYARMLGRTPDEIVGKSIVDVIGRQGFETIRPHIEAVLQGQRVEYEADVHCASVGPRRVHVIYTPERGEQGQQGIGWIASIVDITESKKIAEDKEQIEKIAAEMGIGIWHLNKRTNAVSWTRPIEEIYGLKASKVRTYDDFRGLVHPDDVEELEKARDAAIRARKSIPYEFRIVRPDGEVRWVMGIGRVIYDDATGEPVRSIGTNIDITERKSLEAQAELQRRELAHLMRVAIVGGLSGGIAHEISQPLASILTNAQAALTLLDAKTPDWKEVAAILDEIVQEDVRAGEVIRRLRGLLKKKDRHETLISLNDLIQSTLQLLCSELITHAVRISTELNAELPLISGDSVELQQVLLNLITNAIEAMASTPPSERKINIATGKTKNGYAEVSVRDYGPGMSPDELKRIFEPFFTTKERGLGLGLSICKMIVDGHHGQLILSNASDGGVVATLLLPESVCSATGTE